MTEEPKSFWQQRLKGRAKIIGWLAILVAAVFLFVFGYRLGFEGNGSISKLILFSLLFSVIISALAGVAVLFVRWLCCWRNLRGVLFGVACVITLVALFYAVENWRGKRAWEKYRRTWEAKGEKFDLVSLAPPPVPDEQNFAMTPLLKAALDFTLTNNRVVWRDTNASARLNNLNMETAASASDTNKLVLGNLEQGTLADLEACGNFYRGNTNYPQLAQVSTSAETILAALGKYDPELDELAEAAAARPRSRFPIEYDCEMPADILLPHLAHVKKLGLAMQLRAIARLELGQSEEAFADLQMGFRLADSIQNEPILIDHLVRTAMLGMDLQIVREGLARHAWSEEQLRELENHLASVNLFAEIKKAMRGERACSVGCIEWARRQGFKFNFNQLDGGVAGLIRAANFMPRGWLYQNMLTMSQMHQDFTIATADENARRVSLEIVAAGDAACADLSRGRRHPYKSIAVLLFPAVNKAVIRSARMQTHVDATRVACALERYRLANGQLPEKLEALVPRFLPAIPNDVMDGQPLRYRPVTDDSYVIYSIGWNTKDDGGELAFSRNGKTVNTEEGDWVWRYPTK